MLCSRNAANATECSLCSFRLRELARSLYSHVQMSKQTTNRSMQIITSISFTFRSSEERTRDAWITAKRELMPRHRPHVVILDDFTYSGISLRVLASATFSCLLRCLAGSSTPFDESFLPDNRSPCYRHSGQRASRKLDHANVVSSRLQNLPEPCDESGRLGTLEFPWQIKYGCVNGRGA